MIRLIWMLTHIITRETLLLPRGMERTASSGSYERHVFSTDPHTAVPVVPILLFCRFSPLIFLFFFPTEKAMDSL